MRRLDVARLQNVDGRKNTDLLGGLATPGQARYFLRFPPGSQERKQFEFERPEFGYS